MADFDPTLFNEEEIEDDSNMYSSKEEEQEAINEAREDFPDDCIPDDDSDFEITTELQEEHDEHVENLK